ncbi:MAG: hypothetical protein IKS94_02795 [Prevotella sp.]|nr:hypothetical protein [Prevotella sp.]
MVKINTYYDSDRLFALWLLPPLYKYMATGYDVAHAISSKLKIKDSNNQFQPVPKTKKATDLFPCVIVLGELRWKCVLQTLSEDIRIRKNILLGLKACLEDSKFKNASLKKIIEADIEFWEKEKDALEKKRKGIAEHYTQLMSFLNNKFSFFNNSSIWVRVVNWDDTEIEAAIKELEYFNEIGLYDYDSAKENLEYNIRLQKETYLDSKAQGHGVYVTPVLYGNENETLNILRDNNLKIE